MFTKKSVVPHKFVPTCDFHNVHVGIVLRVLHLSAFYSLGIAEECGCIFVLLTAWT